MKQRQEQDAKPAVGVGAFIVIAAAIFIYGLTVLSWSWRAVGIVAAALGVFALLAALVCHWIMRESLE